MLVCITFWTIKKQIARFLGILYDRFVSFYLVNLYNVHVWRSVLYLLYAFVQRIYDANAIQVCAPIFIRFYFHFSHLLAMAVIIHRPDYNLWLIIIKWLNIDRTCERFVNRFQLSFCMFIAIHHDAQCSSFFSVFGTGFFPLHKLTSNLYILYVGVLATKCKYSYRHWNKMNECTLNVKSV